MTEMEFIHLLRRLFSSPFRLLIFSTALLQKMRARVTRDGTKCAKNSTFNGYDIYFRGTQRQFSEDICSEEDLRSRIFGTFVGKFLARLPLVGFSTI